MPTVAEEHELPPDNHFVGVRMLCLDGGGSRGLIMTVVAEDLESKLNSSLFHCDQGTQEQVYLYQLFDLIAGTSTGGILAAALGLKHLSGQECKELYKELIPKLFEPSRWAVLRAVRSSNWYSEKTLEELLQHYFPKKRYASAVNGGFAKLKNLKGSPVVCVPAYNRSENKSVVFSNIDDSIERNAPAQNDVMAQGDVIVQNVVQSQNEVISQNDVEVYEALRATSAAPTYFPHATINGQEYVDGGLGANCPAVIGLRLMNDYWNPDVDLTTPNPFELETPRLRTCELLVSLGTGKFTHIQRKDSGWWRNTYFYETFFWANKIADMVTDSEAIFQEAQRDLKHANRFAYPERINPDSAKDEAHVESKKSTKEKGLGDLKLDSIEVGLMQTLTNEWLVEQEVQEALWRTTYKIIAKNYYVDIDTEMGSDLDKNKYIVKNHTDDKGWLKFKIKQRKRLFQIPAKHFVATCENQTKETRTNQRIEDLASQQSEPQDGVDDGELRDTAEGREDVPTETEGLEIVQERDDLVLRIEPSKNKVFKEDVKIAVWYEPPLGSRKDGWKASDDDNTVDVNTKLNKVVSERSYLIAGCPFTFTMYHYEREFSKTVTEEGGLHVFQDDHAREKPREGIGMEPQGAGAKEKRIPEERPTTWITEPRELTTAMLLKLATRITSRGELYELGIVGLGLEIFELEQSANDTRSIQEAAWKILRRWMLSQYNRREAYENLFRALVRIKMHWLAAELQEW